MMRVSTAPVFILLAAAGWGWAGGAAPATAEGGAGVVATYRGRPVRLPGGVSAGAALEMTLAASEGFNLSPEMISAAKQRQSRAGLTAAIGEAIVDYWLERGGKKIDPAVVEAESRKVMRERFGTEQITVARMRRLLDDAPLAEMDTPPILGLLLIHLRDPDAAQKRYEDLFQPHIPREEWDRLRRRCKNEDAFRTIAAEAYAPVAHAFASIGVVKRMRERALKDVLVAEDLVTAPEDLRAWFQSELRHVTILRADLLALFAGPEPGVLPPGTPAAPLVLRGPAGSARQQGPVRWPPVRVEEAPRTPEPEPAKPEMTEEEAEFLPPEERARLIREGILKVRGPDTADVSHADATPARAAARDDQAHPEIMPARQKPGRVDSSPASSTAAETGGPRASPSLSQRTGAWAALVYGVAGALVGFGAGLAVGMRRA